MQPLEDSCAVRLIYTSLGAKGLKFFLWGPRVVPCGRKDGNDETNNFFLNFINSPEKTGRYVIFCEKN